MFAEILDCSDDKPGSGVGTEGAKVPPPSGGTPSAYEINPLMSPDTESPGTDEPTAAPRPAVINTFHLVHAAFTMCHDLDLGILLCRVATSLHAAVVQQPSHFSYVKGLWR